MPTDGAVLMMIGPTGIFIFVFVPLIAWAIMSALMPDTMAWVGVRRPLKAYAISLTALCLLGLIEAWDITSSRTVTGGFRFTAVYLLLLHSFFVVPFMAAVYFPLSLIMLKRRCATLPIAAIIPFTLAALVAFVASRSAGEFFSIWLQCFLAMAAIMLGFSLGMGFAVWQNRKPTAEGVA